MMTQTSADISV